MSFSPLELPLLVSKSMVLVMRLSDVRAYQPTYGAKRRLIPS
jgi:hypothetical protein